MVRHFSDESEPRRPIADRYKPTLMLGRGAFGEVWKATDTATGDEVAVKLLPLRANDGARVRREAAALRWLAVPGVVHLRDEGTDGDHAFLVMDLVSGSPFPGRSTPCSWADLEPLAHALLETLSRVHAAGIVHRDLKPANVLVTSSRSLVLLDFGIARFVAARPDDLTTEGEQLGTPAYLAPEQIRGDAVTARTDLYAVGVLLYDTLAGRLPHETSDLSTLLRARLLRPPAPLEQVSVATPIQVARAIDRLLAIAPEDRPASALEAIGHFAGQATRQTLALPWIGPTSDLDLVESVLREGKSMDLAAKPGSGRTRFVAEIAERLSRPHRSGVRPSPTVLAAGSTPFASLESVIGTLRGGEKHGLAAQSEVVLTALVDVFSKGGVLLVDGVESLDGCSAAVMEEARKRGPVFRIVAEPNASREGRQEVPIKQPILEPDYGQWFAGRDRLFHLREDAAKALFERAGGSVKRAAEELSAWVRANVARPDGPLFRVDRDALDSFQEGFSGSLLQAADSAPEAVLPRWVAEVAAWAAVAGDPAAAVDIARAAELPRYRVEAAFADLVHRGFAHPGTGEAGLPTAKGSVPMGEPIVQVRLCGSVRPANIWPEERIREAHRQLANTLIPGAPRRLLHLLSVGDTSTGDLVREALSAAARLALNGQDGAAVSLLEEAARLLRSEGTRGTVAEENQLETEVLSAWLDMAMSGGSPAMLDRVLYTIDRARHPSPIVARLGALGRAALAEALEPGRALRMATELGPMGTAALERRRLGLRMSVARSGTVETEERVFDEVAMWAKEHSDSETTAWLSSLCGRLRYRQSKFEEAATEHLRAAKFAKGRAQAVLQNIHAAAAWLEAFRHAEAKRVAESALLNLRTLRLPVLEARATWALRTALYRLGETTAADVEFVEAVEALGLPYFAPLVALTEGAVAFRTGELELGQRLAKQAAAGWESARIQPEMTLLARALNVACGAEISRVEMAGMEEAAQRCRVLGVGAQVLGLLGWTRPKTLTVKATEWESLTAEVPVEHWSKRIDVLSMEEAEKVVMIL